MCPLWHALLGSLHWLLPGTDAGQFRLLILKCCSQQPSCVQACTRPNPFQHMVILLALRASVVLTHRLCESRQIIAETAAQDSRDTLGCSGAPMNAMGKHTARLLAELGPVDATDLEKPLPHGASNKMLQQRHSTAQHNPTQHSTPIQVCTSAHSPAAWSIAPDAATENTPQHSPTHHGGPIQRCHLAS